MPSVAGEISFLDGEELLQDDLLDDHLVSGYCGVKFLSALSVSLHFLAPQVHNFPAGL